MRLSSPLAVLSSALDSSSNDSFVRRSKGSLGDNFLGQSRVGRVDAAQPGISEQTLHSGLPEYTKPARYFQGLVYHTPRAFHRPVFGRDYLGRPLMAVVDTIGPVLGYLFDMGFYGFQFHEHLSNAALHRRMVRH